LSERFRPLVLCYHGFSDEADHELLVRPRDLFRQVRLLQRWGYRPASAAEVLSGRGRLLHVTFDDAFKSVLVVLDDLERLGVPATVFTCSDLPERGWLDIPEVVEAAARHPGEFDVMGWEELRELSARGVEVGAHTCSHPRLTTLGEAELNRELYESKQRIEAELGRACSLIAYPYGDEDGRVREAARRAGYRAAFALPGHRRGFDLHDLPRVGLYRKDGSLRAMLKTAGVARR